MFGKIQLEQFDACKLPQKAASAWSAVANLVGATYKPLIYLGEQTVHGTNFYFVAEEILMTHPLIRRVIRLTIHESDGKYRLLDESITEII